MRRIPLRDITPLTLTRFSADLEADGVGSETIRRCVVLLQSMLARAVEWQMIRSNPSGRCASRAHGVTARSCRSRQRSRGNPPRAQRTRQCRRRHARVAAPLCRTEARGGARAPWRHVRERTLLIEHAVCEGELKGQKNGRPPRTVDLLAPLTRDLAEWRLAHGRPPAGALLFTGADGTGPWRDHDYRNWRGRDFKPAARAAGHPSARPYDLRPSFASLLLHEGRVSVVDLAARLGHAPTMTLNPTAT